MKLAPNLLGLLMVALSSSVSLKAEDLPDIKDQIQGEWIAYRGDRFDIRRISEGKMVNSYYDWNGRLLFERTSDLKMKAVGSGERRTVVAQGAEWHYLAGGKKPQDTLWTTLSFDADKQGWSKGPAGFGYADGDDTTILNDMQDKYLSAFIRREFEIPKGADMKGLSLLINYDDGFILHANGRRLFASSNVSVDQQSGEITVSNHEATGAESFSLAEFSGVFKEGRNVIAIEGINATLDSSDFTLDPQIVIGGSGRFIESNRSVRHESPRTDWYFKNRAWNGKVDNLQIWNRPLTDAEVVTLWNNGKGTAKLLGGLADGLVGHWPLDGNFKDASGNERHATAKNSPSFVKGHIGQGLDLNGEDQYVVLGGKATDYTPEDGSITMSLWFSADRFDKRWQTLLSLGNNGWGDWRIHREGFTKNMQFVGVRTVRNRTPILDGSMHHLVAIAEKGKGVRLFIDNNLVSNNAPAGQAANFAGIPMDKDGHLPALGANLEGLFSRAKPSEGEFTPIQGALLVRGGWDSGSQNSISGRYRRVDHPEEALLIAARKGDLKKVESLLKSGVDPNIVSRNSYSALSYAAAGGHLKLVKFLLENGADVNKQARFMKNPLNVVAGTPHIESAKLLLANGAKPMPNANGASIVHEAIFWKQPEMLKFILSELKVGVDPKANNGATPLHYALWNMQNGDPEGNKPFLTGLKILLKHGADPNQRFTHNNNNRSALEFAEFKGLDEIVTLLKAQ